MSTRKIVLTAIFIALVYVGTLIIQFPIPGTNGYVNLGDSFILLSGYFFGPLTGFLAGGLGSSLSDITTGYALWAPFTLIIKGLMGAIMGFLVKTKRMNFVLIAVIVEIIMIIGYLLAEWLITGNLMVSLTAIPANGIQGVIGIVLFMIFKEALERTGFKKIIQE